MPERRTLSQRMAAAGDRVAAARRTGAAGAPSQPPGDAASAGWIVTAAAGADVVLLPGQMSLGRHAASISTLLGSCVAVTLWHPGQRMGGMCHYLLPSRLRRRAGEAADGRFGDEAIEQMVSLLRHDGVDPAECHAHLYGGADTMPDGCGPGYNIGQRNIEQGWQSIDRFGFQLQGVDVGDHVPRSVRLALDTGEVTVRRCTGTAPRQGLDD